MRWGGGGGGRVTTEEDDGRVMMKSSGGGKGAQFDEAALNQPITVKENVSWCVSSCWRRKGWKARRLSAYESCGNKYKSVSPAVMCERTLYLFGRLQGSFFFLLY